MKKCHDCGHEHPNMASAARRLPGEKEWQERLFCHESDHSCYQDRYGSYFDGRPVVGMERALEIINDALKKDTT